MEQPQEKQEGGDAAVGLGDGRLQRWVCLFGGLLLGVVGVDLGGDVAITNVRFVDQLVGFDGFGRFPGTLQNVGEVIKKFLFLVIEGCLLLDSGLEGAGGEVMEATLREALAEVIESLDAMPGVGLGFLEFGDGFVVFADPEKEQAEIEPDLEVVGIAFGELSCLAEYVRLPFGFEPGPVLLVIGSIGIELLDLLFVAADGGFGNHAFEGRVGGAFDIDELLVTGQGAVVILLLGMEFSNRAEQPRMIGILGKLGFEIGDLLGQDVGSRGVALLLFEGGGSGFITKEVAKGAGAAFERFVAFM